MAGRATQRVMTDIFAIDGTPLKDLPEEPASRISAEPPERRVFVKSYGCQMNVYDSERMVELLAGQGYGATDKIEEAELVVLNTCHIRERATEKIYSELGKIRQLKADRRAEGRATHVVVAGCVAQAEGGEILRREKAVDAVVGPQSYQRLPQLLPRLARGERAVETDFDIEGKFALRPDAAIQRRPPAAFLTIQEGCDKFCTFCVVPYTRGAEISRPLAAITEEARRLVDQGVREVTLLGQNVNAYHGPAPDGRTANLAGLCHALAGIEGLGRIRYTTSHPNDVDEDLIAAHRDLPALMPFLHLPVQSGSDRILKAMNRKHDAASYRDIVARLRAARPDLALSSDFIVGFPGETDGEFEATLDLIREIGFASTFSFKYSARPGTPAADMEDQVPDEVMRERLSILQDLVESQRQAFNTATVGRTLDVLFERPGRHPGQLTGKSPYLQQVQVDAPEALIGTIQPVAITATGPNSLFGRLDAPNQARGPA